MDEKNKKDFKTVIAIIFVISVMVIITYFSTEHKKDNNEYDKYSYKNREMSYEEFNKEYSEFSEDFDIGENNYYRYEEDAFSMKYSSRIDVDYKLQTEDKKLYIFLTNNTALEVIDAKVGIVYYDIDGNIIDTDYRYEYNLEKGNECCETEYIRSNRIEDVKIVVNAKESNRDISIANQVKTEVIGEDKDMKIKVTNESDYTIERITGEIVFYDEEDSIVSSSNIYIYDKIKPKASKTDKIYAYKKKYTKYKVYINSIEIQ